MGAYFRAWRRKAGIVMLVSTCLFTAGWVRSRTHADWIVLFGRTVIVSGHQRLFVLDRSQVLGFVLESTTPTLDSTGRPRGWSTRRVEMMFFLQRQIANQFGWGSATPNGVIAKFGISDRKHKLIREIYSYWLIITPMMLLSAFLLLSKLRSRAAIPDGRLSA